MCTAGYCGAINYAELSTHPQCKEGCFSNNVGVRWRVTEGWIWVAAASLFLALVVIAVGFQRDLLHTARIMGPTIAFLTLAVISYIIALSVFGSTMDIRRENQDEVCPFAEGCFYWGPAAIAAFVGVAIAFFAWLLAVIGLCIRCPHRRGILLAWAFLLALISLGFAFGAVFSPKWVFRSLPFTNNNVGWSVGPINMCVNGNCGGTDQIWVLNTSCYRFDPFNHRSALRARFGTGDAFLCAAIVTSALIFIFAVLNWPLWCFIMQLLTLAFLIVGTSILGHTWGWWLGCGPSYCDFVTLTYGFDCNWGFTPAAAITAILLTTLLILAWIIMWACRRIDRAPDTTQVAVTTIAQPPAVPVGPRGAAVVPRA
jgi:hypothetical protein